MPIETTVLACHLLKSHILDQPIQFLSPAIFSQKKDFKYNHARRPQNHFDL